MEELYLRYETFNESFYSVDMLRLKTMISYSEFSEIEFRFETCWKDYVVKKWNGRTIDSFKYNYDLEIEEGIGFYFGFFHNSEKPNTYDDIRYNFTVEFNPNKVRNNKMLMYILNRFSGWIIKSFDLAVDFRMNVMDVVFDKGRKRKVQLFINSYDDRTIYIGKGNGRVKIYNKKKESNLNVNYELTRVELSIKDIDYDLKRIRWYKFDESKFPCLYYNRYPQLKLDDYNNKTLMALLYAVRFWVFYK